MQAVRDRGGFRRRTVLFAREKRGETELCVHAKDSDSSFSLGVMQPERCEGYDPWAFRPRCGRGARRRRVATEELRAVQRAAGNVQRMAAYYYLSAREATRREAVMAYTQRRCVQAGGGFKTVLDTSIWS